LGESLIVLVKITKKIQKIQKKKKRKMEVGQFLPVVPPGLAEGWQYSIFDRHLN
jgi:hypothetical protein